MARFNAASRVVGLLRKATADSNGSVLEIWMRVFGVASDHPDRYREVLRYLVLLLDQVKLARKQVAATGADPDAYVPSFEAIEWAIRPENLSAGWSTQRERLLQGPLDVVSALSEFIPADGNGWAPEELPVVASEIAELTADLKERTLPDDLRRFLAGQLALLGRAISEYPLLGPESLQTSAVTAATEWASAPPSVKDERYREEVSRVLTLWRKITGLAKTAALVYVVASAALGDAANFIAVAKDLPELLAGTEDKSSKPRQLPTSAHVDE